jgi:hypothetical protein
MFGDARSDLLTHGPRRGWTMRVEPAERGKI